MDAFIHPVGDSIINYLPFLTWEQKGWLFDLIDQFWVNGIFF